MARKLQNEKPQLGRLQRVASAVKRLFSRGRETASESMSAALETHTPDPAPMASAPKPGRTTRREADIPMDVISDHYNPRFTGGKAGFRSDGADHQNDQEFAYGVADERWNDEDRLTNKSGDPRIGTHRRTYEPGETRTESRD
jgi:hypothetical protein